MARCGPEGGPAQPESRPHDLENGLARRGEPPGPARGGGGRAARRGATWRRFRRLSPPPLGHAVAELAAQGVRRFATVPLMLVSVGPAENDLPAALAREQGGGAARPCPAMPCQALPGPARRADKAWPIGHVAARKRVRIVEFGVRSRRPWWDQRMSDLRIRAAGPGDLDAVLAFWRTAAEGTSISDDRDGVERLVGHDPEALILAERDGELVGTVIAGFDGWRCHLYRLAVSPARRRQGIGSALLTAAEERFVRLGGRRGDAMVLQRNESAHHAWRAAGYAPEEHWRRWVKPLIE
ncbi:hypothetical protein GCM10010372_41750 [Streptomyces tauricus]|nr:hypothetical protein GCM10010372_41750 [Streptomyces tauricus]